MNYLSKMRFENEMKEASALKAMKAWQTCPLRELEAAAKIFDGALFLLIRRYAGKFLNEKQFENTHP